ncbi:MAG: aspartate 1-decarboxylase [Kiritimatiellae bacterium]|nr:aspartate 1-decarboxylase [Kiritimatiellia bacterium]
MQRIMLKSKIHRVVVTAVDLDYEGSLALDESLLRAANIAPGEQVHVYNVANGHRWITYAIPAPAGSGTVMLNGAAARLGVPGDPLIVATFAVVDEKDLGTFRPTIVRIAAGNRPARSAPRRRRNA